MSESIKTYIPHRLMVINENVTALDPVISEVYKLSFDWANRMGIEGKRVYDLEIKFPDIYSAPLSTSWTVSCKIECTEEERDRWAEEQKLIYEEMILDGIKKALDE